MTPKPGDVIAFRRVKEGGKKGKPWEGPEGSIYPEALGDWEGSYTLERIENPVLLTPEMVEAVRVFTDGRFLMSVGSYPGAVDGLRRAFGPALSPPQPKAAESKVETVRERVETIACEAEKRIGIPLHSEVMAMHRLESDAIDDLRAEIAAMKEGRR